MSGRNKGFDPLSSLFEAPEPGRAAPPEKPAMPPGFGDEPTGIAPRPSPEEVAAALPSDPSAVAVPEPTGVKPPAAQPAPAKPPQLDKAAIAKAVAAAAAARIKAQQKAAPTPAPAPAPAQKPRALAPTPEVPKPAPKKKGSRLDALAKRAVRPKGDALAAARAAAAAETKQAEEAHEESVRAHVQEVRDKVAALVPSLLPGVQGVRVANALIADARPVLTALWKAHRARFAKDGQLERAVAAAAVLHALETVPSGELVAAHVETGASDYLVWIDAAQGSLLAAFADARAYFAG